MTDSPAPRRSDAARNRERILNAARDAFAEPDTEVSMIEIARRSGVGSATLYRNFGSRQELLAALYIDEVDEVCTAASTVDGDSAGARFRTWLHRFFEYVTSKRPVAVELLEQTDRSDPVFGASRDRVLAAGAPLLSAARETHEVAVDLTLDQILDMVVAVAKIPGDPAYLEPILHTVLAGLASPGHETTGVRGRR